LFNFYSEHNHYLSCHCVLLLSKFVFLLKVNHLVIRHLRRILTELTVLLPRDFTSRLETMSYWDATVICVSG